jgi:hypothetical protein
MKPLLRYDLGGVGRGTNGRTTVNLAADCDVHHDIRDLDGFIPEDGVVDEFLLSHTLEHIGTVDYREFLQALHRKCRIGGSCWWRQRSIWRAIPPRCMSSFPPRTSWRRCSDTA